MLPFHVVWLQALGYREATKTSRYTLYTYRLLTDSSSAINYGVAKVNTQSPLGTPLTRAELPADTPMILIPVMRAVAEAAAMVPPMKCASAAGGLPTIRVTLIEVAVVPVALIRKVPLTGKTPAL